MPLSRPADLAGCGVLLLIATLASAALAADDDQAAARKSQRFALLIGIQEYPNLAPAEQLEGCRNDVALMKSLLHDLGGFEERDIVTLVDRQATAQAIRTAIAELVAKVRAGPASGPPAFVVLHYSGHGSQVPDQPIGTPGHDEADGLDETLVPYDALKQASPIDIRDDEIDAALTQIQAGGKARTWVVLDCCHSGTGARGGSATRQLERELTPTAAGDIPTETASTLPLGVACLSACRAAELEPEVTAGDRHFGLLTRTLCEVARGQARPLALTFERLHMGIVARYQSEVIGAPSPQLELGKGADRLPVFDVSGKLPARDQPATAWPVRVPAANDDDRIRIEAGRIHGLTAGSLFELYARPEEIDQPGKSVAWLKVESVGEGTADVSAFRWKNDSRTEADEDLAVPAGLRRGFAVERRHSPGDPTIHLRVARVGPDGRDGPPLSIESAKGDTALGTVVEALLDPPAGEPQTAGEGEKWLVWCPDREAPDFLLRVDGRHAAIFPATGVARLTSGPDPGRDESIPQSLRGGWGPFLLPDAAGELRGALLRIARARNLIRLASADTTDIRDSDRGANESLEAPPRVDLELLKAGPTGLEPVTSPPGGSQTLGDGEVFAIRIKNSENDRQMYVTLLLVTPDMGISVLLPFQEGDQDGQRLVPGQELTTLKKRLRGSGDRRVLALATRKPHNLFFLGQPDLPLTRGGGPAACRGPSLGIYDAVGRQVFAPGEGRRGSDADAGRWSIRLLQWQAVLRPAGHH